MIEDVPCIIIIPIWFTQKIRVNSCRLSSFFQSVLFGLHVFRQHETQSSVEYREIKTANPQSSSSLSHERLIKISSMCISVLICVSQRRQVPSGLNVFQIVWFNPRLPLTGSFRLGFWLWHSGNMGSLLKKKEKKNSVCVKLHFSFSACILTFNT